MSPQHPLTRPMTGLATGLAMLALLTGCHHRPGPDLTPPLVYDVPQTVPARDVFSLEVAERICGIESLNRQYDGYRREVSSLTSARLPNPYYTPEAHEREVEERVEDRVTRPEPGPQTAQVELVRTLETDVDASYRFATSACQSYAVCMYQNRYDENACNAGRAEWNNAQVRFEGLSARIADTRVELARLARPGYHPGHHAPRPSSGNPACSDRMGGIFSTAGCRP